MKNKIFSLALLLSMSMIVTAGVWAQNLPASIWTSPQSATTEGRYRSNADDFIRPDAYLGVKFNKWFGLLSFLWDENNNNYHAPYATAGFATKVNGIYIGTFYSGNLWTGAPVYNYTEREIVPNGGVSGKSYSVYDPINVAVMSPPVNNFSVLIGVKDMGFRLTYRTNHQSFSENDIVLGATGNSTGQLYKSYSAGSGYLAPQFAWAMAKDLTKGGIRPYVTIDLVFNRDNQDSETAGPDANGVSGSKIGRSGNHLDPSFGLGLGGYTVYNKDGFKLSCDLDYVLTLNIYDNEYSYEENGVYKTGTIKGTYSPSQVPFTEKSYVYNSVTPSLSGSWSQDKVALKFKLNMPLTFVNEEASPMVEDAATPGNLIYIGTSASTFSFSFRPDIRFAMQYKIIPDKLTLNVGARIQATAITLNTISQTQYNNSGDVLSGSERHESSYGGSGNFVSRFSIGPTFNFTENIWLEANTGVTNAYGDGAIDIFAPGGLFSFGNILVALKF